MFDARALELALVSFGIGLPRILVTLLMLSFFSGSNSTPFIRTCVAATFVLPALPLLIAQVSKEEIEAGWIFMSIVKEAAVGLCLGFAIAIPFWAAEAIGFVIDNQRGASTSTMQNTTSGDESSPLGIFVNQAYLVLFLSLGGLPLVLGAIYESYAVWPIAAALPRFSAEFSPHYLGLFDNLMRTAIVFAAPAMIAMLLSELALAIVSLFAPQMQVFFLAMPIKSGVALFVLLIYFPTLLHYLGTTFTDVPALVKTLGVFMR